MDDSNLQSRRRYLLLAGGVSTLGIAGCTGDGADAESPGDETQNGGGSSNDDSTDADGDDDSGTAGDSPGDSPSDGDDTTDSGDTADDQSTIAARVDVVTNAFEPAWVTVDVGDTVEWTLSEGSHTVTLYHRDNGSADHRAPDGVMAFDDDLDDGRFEWTFDTEGVYDYYCRPHESAGMVGSVVVGEPESGEPGLTSPSSLPGGAADAIEEFNASTRSQFGLDQSGGDDGSSDDDSGYGGGYGY
jgi:plastocyanin